MSDHLTQSYRMGYRRAVQDAMSSHDVAEQLDVTREHVSLLSRSSHLPSARQIGRDWVYWPEDVEVLANRPGSRRAVSMVPQHLAWHSGRHAFEPRPMLEEPSIEVEAITPEEITALRGEYGLTNEDLDRIVTEMTGESVDRSLTVDPIAAGQASWDWERGKTRPTLEQTWALRNLRLAGCVPVRSQVIRAYEALRNASDVHPRLREAMETVYQVARDLPR